MVILAGGGRYRVTGSSTRNQSTPILSMSVRLTTTIITTTMERHPIIGITAKILRATIPMSRVAMSPGNRCLQLRSKVEAYNDLRAARLRIESWHDK